MGSNSSHSSDNRMEKKLNILVWGDGTNTCGVTTSAQQQQQQVKREEQEEEEQKKMEVEKGIRKDDDDGDDDAGDDDDEVQIVYTENTVDDYYDSYPFVQSKKRRTAGPSFQSTTATTLSTKTKSNIHDDTINDNVIEHILYGEGDDNDVVIGGEGDNDGYDDSYNYDNNETLLSESPCKKKKMKHSWDGG